VTGWAKAALPIASQRKYRYCRGSPRQSSGGTADRRRRIAILQDRQAAIPS